MSIKIRDEAEIDLEAAFDWYYSRGSKLGTRFMNEFVRAAGAVAKAPDRWPAHPHIDGIRRYRLQRFPFALAYRVEGDECVIYAVEDLRRRPGYWQDRLSS